MTHILSLPRLGTREALLAASAADSTCKTGGIMSSGPYLGLLYPVVTVKSPLSSDICEESVQSSHRTFPSLIGWPPGVLRIQREWQ